MPRMYHCPFYTSTEKSGKIHCEAACIQFVDKATQEKWRLRYCSNMPGWQQCQLAQMMNDFYYGKDKRK